jgi:hypothetical protein
VCDSPTAPRRSVIVHRSARARNGRFVPVPNSL